MQPSRRGIVRGVAAAFVGLAGCGRSLRENSVPGGLMLRNKSAGDVTITVRAALRPQPTDTVTSTPTATDRTATPLERPELTETFAVDAGSQLAVPDFFPRAGEWAVEAVVDGRMGQTDIELHASIPGPTGADTVVVTVLPGGRVDAEATQVD